MSLDIEDLRYHLDFLLLSLYSTLTNGSKKVAGETTAGAGKFNPMSNWASKTDYETKLRLR